MKKGTWIFISLAGILLILGFTIPITVQPSADTRTIVDHTLHVYSAPECFDQADLTNNLEETTYHYANELEYESESSCTDNAFIGEKKPLLMAIFD
ncbi:hypothetical protein [Halalkalibacter hemicellulosilyticus]|uniref:hypothetical protein n=1 Tax=Halalkalibacter hemicellulosilyticus TaxID=127886 RepID=UPI0005501CB1|nr:hypothetical protein [Halalkalibacter hemicellulosilyticus]